MFEFIRGYDNWSILELIAIILMVSFSIYVNAKMDKILNGIKVTRTILR